MSSSKISHISAGASATMPTNGPINMSSLNGGTNLPIAGMNTSNTMLNIGPDAIDTIDLSNDDRPQRPRMGPLAFNPLLQKRPSMRTNEPEVSLEDPFVGGDYGRNGKVCSAAPSTLPGPREVGGSSRPNVASELDYFNSLSDSDSDTTPMPKGKGRINASVEDSYPGGASAASNVAFTSVKRRKFGADRSSRTSSPGLFMTPEPESTTTHKTPMAPLGKPVKASFQAPSSFGAQARGITKRPHTVSKMQLPTTRPRSDTTARAWGSGSPFTPMPQPQLAQPTGIDHIDITASLKYMKDQIERTSAEIVQPVIDLTKMVKKLKLENANLLDQLQFFQSAMKKSISEIHERQDEHEELIDRLSSDHTINPAGTAFGGPRNTAVKQKSLFQGMLSGESEGMGSPGVNS